MKLKTQKISSDVPFKGYRSDPKAVGNFLLKKREFNHIDTLSFLTALTSMTGFTIGGSGLLSDYANDLKNKNKINKTLPSKIPSAFKNFETIKNYQPSIQDAKSEGARTIKPSTKFAKVALVFAKIGIAFSGIAGVFNGISMGLPLMAAGEALNVCASPIIETPLGTGLFGIALAAVFSGRALEHDPMLRMDKVKLSQQKGVKNKAVYIAKNMADCAKEVWNTTKSFAKQTAGLFSKTKRPDAVNFFKNNVFTIKPKNIVIQEFIDKEAKMSSKLAFKNNPYLMHAASFVLAVGGLTLALSSIFKNKAGQKVGLTTYETGGSLDNLSLSRSGWEKAATASTSSTKLAGNLLGLSGLAILAGQPGVDTKWGRGTQWIGTALLFAVFAVERKANAFKKIISKPKLESLIRQWEIDLTKLYTSKELNSKIFEKQSLLDCIIKYVKNEKDGLAGKIANKKEQEEFDQINKILEGSKFKNILTATREKLEHNSSIYRENSQTIEDEIKDEILKNFPELDKNLNQIFKKEGREGSLNEITSTLQNESDKIFMVE